MSMTLHITIPNPQTAVSPYQLTQPTAPNIVNEDFFESFADILDVVNPLQHLPGVSTLYRELTGDTISTGAKLTGGALYSGPVGFLTSLINAIIEEETGKDIGSNLFASATNAYNKTSSIA